MNNELLEKISDILIDVRNKKPIVHCITNNVTINDCANAILSVGGSPIMTNSIKETEEVTSLSNSLLLNIGTLNDLQVHSMILSGKKAKSLNIPIVFDPVGSGATKYRTEISKKILKDVKPDIIRGNISEIKSLLNMNDDMQRGVDSSNKNYDKYTIDNIIKLSNETNSIIVATGKIDIICFKENVFLIKNGSKLLRDITGTGCMLSSIISCYSGLFQSNDKDNLLKSSLIGTLIMGISGELSEKKIKESSISLSTYINIGTFHLELFNNFYNINRDVLINVGKIEKY